jgi:bifunctional DNA-binding transcriptional regulator/antitoxin component of YhaV-PrlF toxin-antitoxin module
MSDGDATLQLEGCESGRIGRSRKPLRCKPPWVRIPLPPPNSGWFPVATHRVGPGAILQQSSIVRATHALRTRQEQCVNGGLGHGRCGVGLTRHSLAVVRTHKASIADTLYTGFMAHAGDVRVSQRGQMSLPAVARHRWGLDGGGEIGFLDVGDAVILVPGGVEGLRRRLFGAITDEDWARARGGFGDIDLANE